jgi:formylglycine-generating enzyme required for sulfatase activity
MTAAFHIGARSVHRILIVLTMTAAPALASPPPSSSELVGTRAGEEREFNITSAIKVPFCWCPAGTFTMGSPPDEPGRRDDETQHETTLTKGFWMAKTECTNEIYAAVMGGKPSTYKDAQFPVHNVSWCQSTTFVQRIAPLAPQNWKFSLPTEAQWEYACRAGTTTPFGVGNGKDVGRKDVNFDAYKSYGAAPKLSIPNRMTRVGSHPANPWGLQDMHGSVYEWCVDEYRMNRPPGPLIDPYGRAIRRSLRVNRGGAWGQPPIICRSASRHGSSPFWRSYDLGFRLALIQTQ